MSDQTPSPCSPSPDDPVLAGRPVGGTEYSWCKAVPCGTGITVLALLLTKPPHISLLQSTLHNLQHSHPILRSKLHFNPSVNTFSYITPPSSFLQIQPFDLASTAHVLNSIFSSDSNASSISPFHQLLEHELNQNTWRNPDHPVYADTEVFFATVYTLSESQWVLALRLHTSACDRTAAATLLRELLGKVGGRDVEGAQVKFGDNEEVHLGIEDLIPNGKTNKPFWARGIDMLGYSLNSLRLANLNFVDANSPRFSQVARLQLNADDTQKLLAGCESRGIKLCGALAAAGLIAARSSKHLPDNCSEKYAVVTLIDCRSVLDPPLSSHHHFYEYKVRKNKTLTRCKNKRRDDLIRRNPPQKKHQRFRRQPSLKPK